MYKLFTWFKVWFVLALDSSAFLSVKVKSKNQKFIMWNEAVINIMGAPFSSQQEIRIKYVKMSKEKKF